MNLDLLSDFPTVLRLAAVAYITITVLAVLWAAETIIRHFKGRKK